MMPTSLHSGRQVHRLSSVPLPEEVTRGPAGPSGGLEGREQVHHQCGCHHRGGNTLSWANENIIIFFWLQRRANLIGYDRKASVEFTPQSKHLKASGREELEWPARPTAVCKHSSLGPELGG